MNILIATHNLGKFERYKQLLNNIPKISFISLKDLNISEKIPEPFDNPKENAIYKSKEYAKISNLLTIAIDESVKTDFLPDNEQPGVFVRRLKKGGKEATDKKILKHWQNIFIKYSPRNGLFIWDNAISYYNPKNNKHGFYRIINKNKISKKFSKIIIPGYPMSSFLIMPKTNKPHSELTNKEKMIADQTIFNPFVVDFKKWVAKEL